MAAATSRALFLAAAAASFAGTALAQATGLEIAQVKAQFANAGLINGTGPSTQFDGPIDPSWFNPVATLTVQYPTGTVALGNNFSYHDVAAMPTFAVVPGPNAGQTFSSSAQFTLMYLDANVVGIDTQGLVYRHYLANGLNIQPAAAKSSAQTITNNSAPITPYAGPLPAAGSGPHRYIQLLFAQPSSFKTPADLSQPGSQTGNMSLSDYVSQSGLTTIVAANYLTVENTDGNAPLTVTPVPTSAVNPATLQTSIAASATKSGGSPATSTGSVFGGAASLSPAKAGTFAAGVALAGIAALL